MTQYDPNFDNKANRETARKLVAAFGGELVTTKTLTDRLGIPKNTVTRYLVGMVNSGLVAKVGSPPHTKWRLVKIPDYLKS